MSDDWLEGDGGEAVRKDQFNQAREFAQRYLVFAETARGRDIMEHWEETILNRATPVNAPLQEYVRDEAQRDLIRGIKRQITLARQEPK